MHDRFIDTNIILYLLDDSTKADKAEHILSQGGVISVQVLNECLATLRKKTHLNFDQRARFLRGVRDLVTVVPITEHTHEVGHAIAERYQFSVYDSLIVASALLAGCTTLLTEDLTSGQVINGTLIIENPMT